MRKLNSQFITRFISEPGLSGEAGVYYGFVETDQYYCMAIAEGYDGEGGKESAKLAVETAIEAFLQKPGISGRRIRSCLKQADRKLLEQSVRIRLKAGILLLVSDYTRFRYGTCGNVMLYALRNAGICHQSMTHTVYQSMVETGELPNEADGSLKETGNLYHYLGGGGQATVSRKIRLDEGDVLLAATESFWSRVNKVEILDAFESIKSEEDFLGDLQELYLRGSTDAVPGFCLSAVNIKKTYKENKKLRKKLWIFFLVAVLILTVGGTILFFSIKSRRQKQAKIRNAVQVYEDLGDSYLIEFNCLLAMQEYENAAAEGKKLSKNEERLENEQDFSGKKNIITVLESADRAFETRNYTQARSEYKRALEMIKEYGELSPLSVPINQRLKQAGTGMEIGNYIQNAALKEAEGDMAAAEILYDQAEAMLRIVDDPEQLQQVQLARLRVREQTEEEDKKTRANAINEVIIDADKTAAMDAVLAGDFEMALQLYEKIRDSYIAMENNEMAEETTQTILSLQRQAREEGGEGQAYPLEAKQEALEAFLAEDYEAAILLYEKAFDAFMQSDDEEGAKEMEAMASLLKERTVAAISETENAGYGKKDESAQPGKEPDMPGAEIGPGVVLPDASAGQDNGSPGQLVGALQKEAFRALAERDYAKAIAAYETMRQTCTDRGNTDLANLADEAIAALNQLKEEAKVDTNG